MISPAIAEVIHRVVKGDPDAMRFFVLILEITEAWDALVDKDEPVSDVQIHHAFTAAMVTVQNNPFYVRNRPALQPLIVSSIINWRIATAVERDPGAVEDLRWAFVIRSSYVDILLMCAALIEGVEWAVEVGPEVRRLVHGEGFDNYLAALKIESAARSDAKPMVCQ